MQRRRTWNEWNRMVNLGPVLWGPTRGAEFKDRTDRVLVVMQDGRPREQPTADVRNAAEVRALVDAVRRDLAGSAKEAGAAGGAVVRLVRVSYELRLHKDTPYDDAILAAFPQVRTEREFTPAEVLGRGFDPTAGLEAVAASGED